MHLWCATSQMYQIVSSMWKSNLTNIFSFFECIYTCLEAGAWRNLSHKKLHSHFLFHTKKRVLKVRQIKKNVAFNISCTFKNEYTFLIIDYFKWSKNEHTQRKQIKNWFKRYLFYFATTFLIDVSFAASWSLQGVQYMRSSTFLPCHIQNTY